MAGLHLIHDGEAFGFEHSGRYGLHAWLLWSCDYSCLPAGLQRS
jgi:hypothetical protein